VLMDTVILIAVGISYLCLQTGHYKTSVIVITSVPLITMFYHAITLHDNSIPLPVFLIIGFAYSILLKGRLMWWMHGITFCVLVALFWIEALSPTLYHEASTNEVVSLAITYLVLYFLMTATTGMLKRRYDLIHEELMTVNQNLVENAVEIEAQNEMLTKSYDKVNDLNRVLEQTVEDRTHHINRQNEQLLKYAYINAHQVRGPIARLLGLINLSKMDSSLGFPELFKMIENETHEIDTIINRISIELEKNGQQSVRAMRGQSEQI
jgi:signal transduction histidine kinase